MSGGKGVSVGTGVSVEIANVGSGEGSITGAEGGAMSVQAQANVASIKAKSGRNLAGFICPPNVM